MSQTVSATNPLGTEKISKLMVRYAVPTIIALVVNGNLSDRAKRVVDEHGIDPAEAEKHVLERDKKRAKYYRHITDQVWGLAENYDLCLNSSKLGVDGCVDLILDCCK